MRFPDLDSSLDKLSIDKAASKKTKKQVVADSWEDEDLSSGEETDRAPTPQQAEFPSAPPPTPISPVSSHNSFESLSTPYGYGLDGTSDTKQDRSSPRPEKTDAVARRMIAGALGMRAPKKTDEQRAYDRALREKEMKRRNQEKEAAARAKEEAERAKAAVWDD